METLEKTWIKISLLLSLLPFKLSLGVVDVFFCDDSDDPFYRLVNYWIFHDIFCGFAVVVELF